MTEEEVLTSWKMGLTKYQIAEKHKNVYNKKQNQKKASEREKTINSIQALSYVEPIIHKYQMRVLRG